jgi:hypothetical protein
MGEVRGAYNILVERPEGRKPLGRPRRRWEDNINRWRALVNTVTNLRVS